MHLTFQELKNLPVYTKSGTYLGRVCDLTLDADSGRILQYEVKNGRLHKSQLLIAHEQILEITKTKIVVQDAIISEIVKKQEIKKMAKSVQAALTSEISD